MTGEAVALELRPTGFALAAAGAAIDFLVYGVGGTLFIVFAVILPLSVSSLGTDSATLSAFLSASIVLVLVVIPVAVELLSHGKSLGRLAVGARIVREDGGAIGFRHAFIRNLAGLVEIYATLGGIAAIFGLLNGKSKRMGDYFAGTYSQYERVPKAVEPTFGVPVELQSWSLTADVARIPNRLAQRMTKFLRQANELTPTTRDHLAAQLAREASIWVFPVPAVNPELFVAAVIALRRDRELAALRLEQTRLDQLRAALTGLPHDFPDRG
ncbi:MAG: hypothetical protein QOH69_687 [Actinomycetota bacterium]|nr:hypothetical protein [Actinomycetota bacterium]